MVHTITCEDVPGSLELDAPCVNGSIYFREESEAASVTVDADLEVVSGYRTVDRGDGSTVELAVRVPDPEETVSGTHAVGGTVTASWIPGEEDDAVLIVDEHPASAQFGYVLVTTDGDRDSMRRVIQGLRNTDEVLFITTRPALTSGITRDTLVANPYLTVMATAAAGLGTVALLYAVLLLFRQRQAEFRILRCQGATRMLLAADLGLLFAGPLVLAFGLAVAAGIGLAVTLNTAYDLPTQFGTARVATHPGDDACGWHGRHRPGGGMGNANAAPRHRPGRGRRLTGTRRRLPPSFRAKSRNLGRLPPTANRK